jgi:hypothetical protein
LNDLVVEIVFREDELGPGESTTFEIFYVWGRTSDEVGRRFDEIVYPSAPCVGLAEAASCTTIGGAAGTCRAGLCCTGCFDGTRCRAGASASSCGTGGGACAACADTDACTPICSVGRVREPSRPAHRATTACSARP